MLEGTGDGGCTARKCCARNVIGNLAAVSTPPMQALAVSARLGLAGAMLAHIVCYSVATIDVTCTTSWPSSIPAQGYAYRACSGNGVAVYSKISVSITNTAGDDYLLYLGGASHCSGATTPSQYYTSSISSLSQSNPVAASATDSQTTFCAWVYCDNTIPFSCSPASITMNILGTYVPGQSCSSMDQCNCLSNTCCASASTPNCASCSRTDGSCNSCVSGYVPSAGACVTAASLCASRSGATCYAASPYSGSLSGSSRATARAPFPPREAARPAPRATSVSPALPLPRLRLPLPQPRLRLPRLRLRLPVPLPLRPRQPPRQAALPPLTPALSGPATSQLPTSVLRLRRTRFSRHALALPSTARPTRVV